MPNGSALISKCLSKDSPGHFHRLFLYYISITSALSERRSLWRMHIKRILAIFSSPWLATAEDAARQLVRGSYALGGGLAQRRPRQSEMARFTDQFREPPMTWASTTSVHQLGHRRQRPLRDHSDSGGDHGVSFPLRNIAVELARVDRRCGAPSSAEPWSWIC
jgi:hypothetical protein